MHYGKPVKIFARGLPNPVHKCKFYISLRAGHNPNNSKRWSDTLARLTHKYQQKFKCFSLLWDIFKRTISQPALVLNILIERNYKQLAYNAVHSVSCLTVLCSTSIGIVRLDDVFTQLTRLLTSRRSQHESWKMVNSDRLWYQLVPSTFPTRQPNPNRIEIPANKMRWFRTFLQRNPTS